MMYPWQQKQWQILQQTYRENRLSHAYLLSGNAGMGKTDFARHFSTFLLCADKKNDACGQCRDCQWMRAGTHPDFMIVSPEEKNHSIKIDQIREMTERVTKTSQRGGYQIVVISPADAMPMSAANALLKTLEEPTPSTLFFLIDDRQHVLPVTIASRCQPLFFLTEEKTMLPWLEKKMPGQKKLSTLLRLCGGAPLKIQSCVEQNYLSSRDQLCEQLIALSQKRSDVLAVASAWLKQDLPMIIDTLIFLAVDISRAQSDSTVFILNQDLSEKIIALSKKISTENLQQWMRFLLEKKSLWSRDIHLNQQLCLETLFIEWEKSCL